ncbi:FadR/GntR family transcriptional regulator [Arthrobacter sp. NPDC056691]|uniref:FadR/GntR family transcriptional regulator n=1 Tax=Arthrobacter sp. NPDC056691 TaxID=3345913 RepID=UPI00366D0824
MNDVARSRTGEALAAGTRPANPAMNGKPAQQKAQVLQIVAEIIQLVELRGYQPGDRIPSEREISERFNIGRSVVREAMAMLESTRYLERKRSSGVFLSDNPETTSLEALVLSTKVGLPLSDKVNTDSIEVRRIIEVQAIHLACLRRTAEALGRISAVLAGFEHTVVDAETASDYDFQFHMEIFRATDNEILSRLVQPFYILSRNRREALFASPVQRGVSHEQHLALFDAIRDQDCERAASLMGLHIGRVDDWFSQHLAQPAESA